MVQPSASPAEEPLRRHLSRLALAALALNGVVGAGIFGLPSRVAALTGNASPLVFLCCALCIAPVMASFAALSSAFSGTGGPILYARVAFGPVVGFQTGWVLYLGRASALAANANLLLAYLAHFLPGADAGALRPTLLALFLALLAGLNLLGLRQGVGALFTLTVLKLLPLFLLVGLGLARIVPSAFAPLDLPGSDDAWSAALIALYAFIGFEGALVPAGEARDPKRDMPRALFLSLGVTAVLYVLVQAVCVMHLPGLPASERPLADVAQVLLGPAGAALMGVGAILSIAGNSFASLLSAPRMTYALALEQSLPRAFAAVHPRWSTPHVSILFYAGGFVWLAGVSTLTRLLGYALCIAALPRVRRRMAGPEGPAGMRLPGGALLPLCGFGLCALLLTRVEPDAIVLTLALIGVGGLLQAVSRRRPS
jgi:amino acid transporter